MFDCKPYAENAILRVLIFHSYSDLSDVRYHMTDNYLDTREILLTEVPTILIVDDDDTVRSLFVKLMRAETYEIVEAQTGAQAVIYNQEYKPHVILMDGEMPELNGFDACATIRDLSGDDMPPVIMITALNDDDSIRLAFEAGAADYITKPVNTMLLQQRVRYLVKAQQSARLHAHLQQLRTDEELRRSETELRTILDNVADGILMSDEDGIILNTNSSMTTIFGYSEEEMVGQHMKMLDHEDDYPIVEAALNRWRNTPIRGLNLRYQDDGKHKNGDHIILQIAVTDVVLSGERRFLGILRDITQQKQSEQDLHEQSQLAMMRERVTVALNTAPDLHEMLRQCGEALLDHLDGAYARFWLVDENDQQTLNLVANVGQFPQGEDIFESVQLNPERLAKLAETNRPIVLNDLQDSRFGNVKWAQRENFRSFVGYPLYAGDDWLGVFGMFSTHNISGLMLKELDTTTNIITLGIKRRRAEKALRYTLQRTEQYAKRFARLNEMSKKMNLAHSEEDIFSTFEQYIGDIIEADHIDILLLDRTREYLQAYVLRGYADALPGEVFLLNYDTVIGRAISDRRLLNFQFIEEDPTPSLTRFIEHGLQSAMITPMIVGSDVVGTVNFSHKEPHYYDAQAEDMILHIASFLGVTITNIRRVEEIDHARELAETANRAKSKFLANMSHELRTPLNGILGYAQILRKQLTLNDEQREGLDIIQTSGEHLLTLINDVLDLSKIEAEKMEIQSLDFDLNETVETLSTMFRLRAQQKGVTFAYEPVTELPQGVHGDQKKLRQVLLNLLSNALKFTDEGGVVLKVGYNEGKMRFQIEDTGIGIDSSDLGTIFQPFKQVGTHQLTTEGTGLGLAISRRLITMMGGYLSVNSRLGEGSTFWFELDLPAVDNFQPPQDRDKRQLVGYHGDAQTVLVVDDRWENRSVLRAMLSPLGFEILEANDGQEGLDKAIKHKPDVILMDIRMPIMDGFEVTRRIRQSALGQSVVIVMISASAFEHNHNDAIVHGGDAFLAKPFRESQLFDILKQHLHLQWVYEDPINHEMLSETGIIQMVITAPPHADLQNLLDYSSSGNLDALQAMLNQLVSDTPAYTGFVRTLEPFIKAFQIDDIENFINKYMEQ